VDWPSYLRKVVSKSAVAAAGAAAGVAASPGGPIAIAAARAAAETLSDDLLTQFLGAHADQMQRIEEISLQLRDQLTGLQNTVGASLDASWHTALTHIAEAGRRPTVHRAPELELARIRLFEAWGVAKSLLERDPLSSDPAALRCPTIAQQIAAVYSFLGETQNTVHWLTVAYMASRNQLDHQVHAVHDIFDREIRSAKKESRDAQSLLIEVRIRGSKSNDPLWIHAPEADWGFSKPKRSRATRNRDPFWNDTPDAYWNNIDLGRAGYIKPSQLFERRLAALIALDAEAQLLRLSCLASGAGMPILRPGTEPISASKDSVQEGECRALLIGGHAWKPPLIKGGKTLVPTAVFVAFDAATAVEVTESNGTDSRFQNLINDRYRRIIPLEISAFDLWGLCIDWRTRADPYLRRRFSPSRGRKCAGTGTGRPPRSLPPQSGGSASGRRPIRSSDRGACCQTTAPDDPPLRPPHAQVADNSPRGHRGERHDPACRYTHAPP
jgi:hypothetical protein